MVDARAARHVDRVLQRHRLRVAEVERFARLGDDDGRLAVRRGVHVVRVVDQHRLAGLAGRGSIGVRLPSVRPSALLVTHSVRRSHEGTMCCGPMPTGSGRPPSSPAGRPPRRRRAQVGHVDALEVALHGRAELAGGVSRRRSSPGGRRHAGRRSAACARAPGTQGVPARPGRRTVFRFGSCRCVPQERSGRIVCESPVRSRGPPPSLRRSTMCHAQLGPFGAGAPRVAGHAGRSAGVLRRPSSRRTSAGSIGQRQRGVGQAGMLDLARPTS